MSLFLVLGFAGFLNFAEARVPVADEALGAALDALVMAAGHSTIEELRPFREVHDIQIQAKAEFAVQRVRDHAGVRWSTFRPRVVILEGVEGEPNAFAPGLSIYFTRGIVQALSLRELEAVTAHELAHAEQGHLLQRLPFPIWAALIHFYELVQSDWNAVTHHGQADAFMEQLWRDGSLKMILNLMDEATLGQEMQADCLAWGWLRRMRRRQLGNDPRDLLSSMEKLLGVTRQELLADPFMGGRFSMLLSGAYNTQRCE